MMVFLVDSSRATVGSSDQLSADRVTAAYHPCAGEARGCGLANGCRER